MCKCKPTELKIKIKYEDGDYPKLALIGENKSDWIDLYTNEEITIKANEFKLIHLGVAMELPKGYEAYILPRSSTFKNYGLLQTNSQAIIDESYKGDTDFWKYPVFATKDITIPKHTRLCQFRIQEKMPTIKFIQVEKLENVDRGGFGTTGKGVVKQ